MSTGDKTTPDKPGSGTEPPVRSLGVRDLRNLVATSARADDAAAGIGRPYAEALRCSVDWLWQSDAEFNLIYVSHGLDESLDGPEAHWIGRSLLALAQGEADEATPSPLLVALRERRAFRDCTVEWTSSDDRRARFRLTGLPYQDEETGAFAGFRGTGSVIGEPEEETQTARDLLDLLKAALSERDQLQQQLADIEDGNLKERLAGIAHELRTPLNAIIGFSELIRDQAFGDDPRRYSEYGGNIHRSGVKLLQLVNRILDTAEHESDLPAIEAGPLVIEPALRHTIEVMADSAAARRVTLYLDVAEDLPLVLGDRQMVRQILFHLMSRILERAPVGWTAGIRALVDDPGQEPCVQVTVWDAPPPESNGERAAPTAGPAGPLRDSAEAEPVAKPESEDLGPVVLQHLAEIMGAELVLTGHAGHTSDASLRLPIAAPAAAD